MAVLPDHLQKLGEELQLPEQEEVAALIRSDLLLPWLQRRLLEALAAESPRVVPSESDLQRLAKHLGADSLTGLDEWRRVCGCDLGNLEHAATFSQRLQAATETFWAEDLPSYFLERRSSLDQATLSVVRFNDADLAQELYFQLHEKEITFPELLEQYSQDPDQPPRCLVGPMSLEKLNPLLARVAERYAPGALIPPLHINNKIHLIRVERLEKASLDDPTRQRLLLELRQVWLQEQLKAAQRRLFALSRTASQP